MSAGIGIPPGYRDTENGQEHRWIDIEEVKPPSKLAKLFGAKQTHSLRYSVLFDEYFVRGDSADVYIRYVSELSGPNEKIYHKTNKVGKCGSYIQLKIDVRFDQMMEEMPEDELKRLAEIVSKNNHDN